MLNPPFLRRSGPVRGRMLWVLPLLLTPSVCGAFEVKKAQTVYQAEDSDEVTVTWDIPTKADMSLTNLVCVFLSKPHKVLYKMIRGEEDPEAQHQQFAGRVRCDRDALRGGRVTLQVSRVTAEDSGSYRCDLAADYDKTRRRWLVDASEHFVLKATRTSPGEKTEGAGAAAGPEEEAGRSEYWQQVKTGLGAVNVAALIFAGAVFLLCAAADFIRRTG